MHKLTLADKTIWHLESFKANFFHLHHWEGDSTDLSEYHNIYFLSCFKCCGNLDDGSRFAWRWNPFTLRY